MSRTFIGFFRGLSTLAKPWWLWVGLLIVVNGVLPWLFLGTIEARVVLVAFAIAALVMMSLFRRMGFVRLLGVGHIIPWVPMLWWLTPRLAAYPPDNPFGKWILAVIVFDGLSLVIDLIDVGRYLAGDRRPTYVLPPD